MGSKGAFGQIVLFGVAAGVLIAAMQFFQYRFVVVEHSIEIYGAIVAGVFAAAGIWLGLKVTREKIVVREVPVEVPVPAQPFVLDQAKVDALGLTPREMEVLVLVAEGLSTKDVAARLFVRDRKSVV